MACASLPDSDTINTAIGSRSSYKGVQVDVEILWESTDVTLEHIRRMLLLSVSTAFRVPTDVKSEPALDTAVYVAQIRGYRSSTTSGRSRFLRDSIWTQFRAGQSR